MSIESAQPCGVPRSWVTNCDSRPLTFQASCFFKHALHKIVISQSGAPLALRIVAVLLWHRRGKAFERSSCPINPSAPCWHMQFNTSSSSTTSLRADLPLLYAAWEAAVTASDQCDMAWNLLDDHTL
eukprot:1682739-Amphidinium_carterae.1